jgi:hypothetical protein
MDYRNLSPLNYDLNNSYCADSKRQAEQDHLAANHETRHRTASEIVAALIAKLIQRPAPRLEEMTFSAYSQIQS